MKKKCRSLKPLSVQLCEKIQGRISLAKADFNKSVSDAEAYDLYITGLKFALEDVDLLKSHIKSLIDIAEYNRPLPF